MIKDNPLYILSSAQLNGLNLVKLKEIKKQTLLEFQLTTEPTIKVNGYEVDKNGVLEAFDAIEADLPRVLFIHQNKVLDDFIKGKNDKLFTNRETLGKIHELDDKRYIEQKIISRLQVILLDNFRLSNNEGQGKLRSIYTFVQNLNPLLEDEVYSKLFIKLQKHVDRLGERFDDQLHDLNRRNLPSEIHRYVSVSFSDSLDNLPGDFEGISLSYSIWCNDVVFHGLKKNEYYKDFRRQDLKAIRNAALCASKYFFREANLEIKEDIDSYLKNGDKGGTWGYGGVIFIVLIIIRLLLLLTRM